MGLLILLFHLRRGAQSSLVHRVLWCTVHTQLKDTAAFSWDAVG